MFKILAGVSVLCLTLVGCAVPYAEQRYGTVTSVTPHWETVTFFDPASGCTVYREDEIDPSARGAIIGGVAGYIVSGGVLGTIVGATAGSVIDGDANTDTHQVCVEGQPPQEQQVISHFNITYEYDGHTAYGTSMTQYEVGDSIPLFEVQALAKVDPATGPIPAVRSKADDAVFTEK